MGGTKIITNTIYFQAKKFNRLKVNGGSFLQGALLEGNLNNLEQLYPATKS